MARVIVSFEQFSRGREFTAALVLYSLSWGKYNRYKRQSGAVEGQASGDCKGAGSSQWGFINTQHSALSAHNDQLLFALLAHGE